jgi:hypothetical protein
MRKFMVVINASIEVDDPGIPPMQRQGGEYIMDMIFTVQTIHKCTDSMLELLPLVLASNYRFGYYGGNGNSLDLSNRLGEWSLQSSQTTWLHMNQAKPSPSEWVLWRKANLI